MRDIRPNAQLQFIIQYLHWCLTPALAVFNIAQQKWTFYQTSNLLSTLPPGLLFVTKSAPEFDFRPITVFLQGCIIPSRSWFGWKRRSPESQKARVSVQIRKAALIKEILFRWPIGRHLSTFQVSFQWFLSFREAPLKQRSPLIGHCPNSDCFPLHSNGHSGALYFRVDLSKFVKSPFW